MLNKLYIIASSEGIGGAEARTVKYAAHASNTLDVPVVLIVNQTLLRSIRENLLLKTLLDGSKLKVEIYEPRWNFVSEGFRNLILKHPKFKKILGLVPKFALKQISWYPFLRKKLNSGDFLHCIFGDTARMGTYFFADSKLGRETGQIVEITSNRHVDTWGMHINYCLQNRSINDLKLNIQCVSETVYGNLLPKVKSGIKGLIAAYPGPFILIPRPEIGSKQDVILYAHRFIPPKNPILFAEAIADLKSEGLLKGWKVYIRGNGALQSDIERILRPLIVEGQVILGFTAKLIEESKIAKVFVSIIETGNYPSNSLFESMRCGNLLVLSDRGVTKEKIGTGKGIHYLDDLTKKDLKESLLKAMLEAKSENFEDYSESVENQYEQIALSSGYLETVNRIYQYGR